MEGIRRQLAAAQEGTSGAEDGVKTLRERTELYEALLAAQSDLNEGLAVVDLRSLQLLHVNDALARILGYPADELLGMEVHPLVAREEHDRIEDIRRKHMRGVLGEVERTRGTLMRSDGTRVAAEASLAPFCIDDTPLLLVIVRDITERRIATRQLKEAERRYRTLVERVPAIVYVAEPSDGGRTTYVSPQVETVLGYTPEEWTSDPGLWSRCLHPEDRERVQAARSRCRPGETLVHEYRLLARDGTVVWVRDKAVAREDEQGRCQLDGLIADITERKLAESQLRYLADHDALTGLVNRRRFADELALEIRLAAREPRAGCVLVLDVDNFKYVNDSLGHQAGDQVIRAVGRLLSSRLRDTDTVARLGGDEFAVLLRHSGVDEAAAVAEELLEGIRRHHAGDGTGGVRVTASAGLAEIQPRSTAEEILAAADLAMYEAKRSGRDRLARFSPDLQVQLRRGRLRADHIRRSLEDDDFVLHSQPIVELRSGEVTQHELLLRMRDDDGDTVPPAEIFPVAERFDLVQAIDRWVMRRAVNLLSTGHAPAHCLHVNVSGKTIGDPSFIAALERELERLDGEAERLVIEITETAAITNMEDAQRFARRVTQLGCRLALDDFGSGFGTFYYLKYLPVDYVKIDGDFVRSLAQSVIDRKVVRSIVELAGAVGAHTVAEFAGDERTVELLRDAGVDFAQGHHFGAPARVEDLHEAAAAASA